MSERNIPHLRDIFGVPFDGVQYSPRSRRRNDHEVRSPTTVSPPSKRFTDLHISPPEPATDPDSAVSVGSSGEEENYQAHKKKQAKDSNRRSRKEADTYNYSGNRTLTQKDVKHLERHLSMKKTIRKKIMRDLRQAFVEDPNEFRMDPERSPLSPDQLREINIHNLSFNGQSDSNFLEILRVESAGSRPSTRSARDDDRDSGHGSPTREPPVRYSQEAVPRYGGPDPGARFAQDGSRHQEAARIENFVQPAEEEVEEEAGKKQSFWKRFTLKGRSSKR